MQGGLPGGPSFFFSFSRHFSATVCPRRGIGGGQPDQHFLNSKKISEHHCIFA
nr:MAG TPA: hypothetical protein [Bacteriophage sp.]